MKSAIAAMGLLLTGGAAHAADCVLPNGFDLSKFSLGEVAGDKVNFVANASEKAGCPSASASCVKRGYLVSKNIVILDGQTAGAYVCAQFIGARGRETDGWLPAASIKPVAAAPNWIGTWLSNTEPTIEIDITRNSKTAADVDGEVHTGSAATGAQSSLQGTIDPTQVTQSITTRYDNIGMPSPPPPCTVTMKQLGPALFVNDENTCGGVATFSARYLRK